MGAWALSGQSVHMFRAWEQIAQRNCWVFLTEDIQGLDTILSHVLWDYPAWADVGPCETQCGPFQPDPFCDLYSWWSPAPITIIHGGQEHPTCSFVLTGRQSKICRDIPLPWKWMIQTVCTSVPTRLLERFLLWESMRYCFSTYTTTPAIAATSMILSHLIIS